jgi:Transglutaminase-like superfamily
MLRTAAWTLRARIRARQAVWGEGIGTPIVLPPAPATPMGATRAVIGVLDRTRATCLVRSLVLQRWLADHDEPVDVVIGVTAPSSGFRAHAWLDGSGDTEAEDFTELHRLPPPGGHSLGARGGERATIEPLRNA